MKRYFFYPRENCEMCGSPVDKHKVKGIRLNVSQGFSPRKKTGIAVTVQQCSHCKLIYSNPLPVPNEIKDHYDMPPESYWTESYFEISPTHFKREIDTIKKLHPFQEGMKALDVGAGIGKSMTALKNAGFDVYGFEPSRPFYERAINRTGIDPQKLRFGMLEEMEYGDEEFDFISFGAVLEHLYYPATCVEKAMKWLKPGGLIHMEVPSEKYLMPRLINLFYRLRFTNYTTHLSPMLSPFHLYEFNIKSFEALGKKAGFSVLHHEYEVCQIGHFPKFSHPFFKAIMKATNTGMQLIVYLKKN